MPGVRGSTEVRVNWQGGAHTKAKAVVRAMLSRESGGKCH